MKSIYARGLWAMLGLVGLIQPGFAAEPFGSASLLPMPSAQQYAPQYAPVARTSYGGFQEEISPSDQPIAPIPQQGPAPSFAPPPVGISPDYKNAMKEAWDGAGGCADESCGEFCSTRACPHFYVYAGGIVLGRADDCGHAITEDASTYQTVINTDHAEQDWTGGVEGRIGWILPNCCNAIEARYFGLWPSDTEYRRDADSYSSGIRPNMGSNLNWVYYDDGMTNQDVYMWMTTTMGFHQIERSFNYNSVEVNLLGNTYAWGLVPCGAGCCGPSCGNGACCTPRLQYGWLAGFRYFAFDEQFALYTDYDDESFDNDVNQLCYHIETDNDLFGFQLGGSGNWCVTNCWSLYGNARFGVYNNHVTSRQELYGPNGYAYINGGSYSGTDYDFTATQDALACVGEIDLGMRYNIGCHWSVMGGYRVIGLAGVATAPGQISQNFADPYNEVCADDTVILHGAYAGAQFAW